MLKQGQLIAVEGAIYEYDRYDERLQMHLTTEVEIDEDGILTATYVARAFTDRELSNRGIELTTRQWYGVVEHFIRQAYDLSEFEIKGAVMDVVDRCFAYGIPQFEELADYIAEYLDR